MCMAGGCFFNFYAPPLRRRGGGHIVLLMSVGRYVGMTVRPSVDQMVSDLDCS